MSNPKFALIPSAVKVSKLYSILPSDGNGDFTFSRSTIATRINKDGLVEESPINTPRLDYRDGGCPELLLEGVSQNLVGYSEDFSQAAWSKPNSTTVSVSGEVSPRGDLSAYEITRGATSGLTLRYDSIVTIGTEYTFSIWAKAGTNDSLTLDIADNGSTAFVLTDEWQRFKITATPTLSTHIDIVMTGGAIGETIHLFGAQVEATPKATSYIPALAGSPVSRSNDLCVDAMLNNPILTANDWTIFLELDLSDVASDNHRIAMSDGTDSNKVQFSFSESSQVISCVTVSGGGASINYHGYNVGVSGKVKIAIVSTETGTDSYINGALNSSKSDGRFDASTMTKLTFTQGSSSLPFAGRIKDFRYYDTNLSANDLIILTQ